jgi:hypothetical protein
MSSKAAAERTHKYYIAKYINRGSSKVVFSSAFSPRTTEIRQSTDTISLSKHQLNNIYIELDSTLSIDFDKVVVACIITSSIEKQRECIENIRLQQLFFSNNMATKIYGIVIMEEEQQLVNPAIEQKPIDGSKYNKEEWTSEPEYSYHYTYHRWNMADDRESGFDTFLPTAQTLLENGLKKTFFVFQERCDFDVVEYVENEIEKNTRNWDGIRSIKSEFEMIVEKIDHYMSRHIKKYIEKGYIDTDYKPDNICILHSDGLDSVAASSVAASSTSDKQTWKSFDFDIRYIHDIKGLDKSFKKYCKLYMIIQFYVIFSNIVVLYREHFVPIISEILRKKHKITKNTIRKVIIFFADFNEQFHEQYETEYNKNIYTPFRSLMNYASRYFNKNILTNLDSVEKKRITDEHKDNKREYLVNAVWAIFGFSGTSVSSHTSSSKSSHTSSSKSSHTSSSKSSHTSSSKSSAKPGGRKVNSSKKHLNKRASTNTNAITKKSKSK